LNRPAIRALFGVSLVLGVMLGLEAHMERTGSANGYATYLELSNELTTGLAQTPQLRRELARAVAVKQALEAASQHAHSGMRQLRAEAGRLNRAAGLTTTCGTGVVITIGYDPNLPVIKGLRYVDEGIQLQMLVNYLLASGAQTISISGQRLVTTSAIRSVSGLGQMPGPFSGTIQVNDVPVQAPYEVSAIGSIRAIENMLQVQDLVDQFHLLDQSFVIKDKPGKTALCLPAYTGELPGASASETGG